MGSSDNIIFKNWINHNTIGILLRGTPFLLFGPPPVVSRNNVIYLNNITRNVLGISLNKTFSGVVVFDNIIYMNNFIENSIHALDDCGKNSFNDSYIGNFWDNYEGEDEDNDGVGDSPYCIPGDGGSIDYKPSIKPFKVILGEEEKSDKIFEKHWLFLTIAEIAIIIIAFFCNQFMEKMKK